MIGMPTLDEPAHYGHYNHKKAEPVTMFLFPFLLNDIGTFVEHFPQVEIARGLLGYPSQHPIAS